MPLLEQVLEKYPQEVKVIFKNFPLNRHKFARPAALAALAAGRQDKFWEFHDALFVNHNKLSEEKIVEIAGQLNLDLDRFNQDRADPTLVRRIEADLQEGGRAAVRGTPSLFVNGRKVKRLGLEDISGLIDKALRKRQEKQEKQTRSGARE